MLAVVVATLTVPLLVAQAVQAVVVMAETPQTAD
jgi:hypothetical protein